MKIDFYREQVKRAETELANLPDTVYGWQMQRRIDAERRALIRDIEHYQGLLEIAEYESKKTRLDRRGPGNP